MKGWLSIRVPIALTIILSLILVVIAWSNQMQLKQVRKEHLNLLNHAESLGLDPDNPVLTSQRTRSIEAPEDIEALAREFIAVGIDFNNCHNDELFSQLDAQSKDRVITQVNRVLSLNQKGLQQLIELIIAEPELDKAVRMKLLNFTLLRWAELNPSNALAFLVQSPQLGSQLDRSMRSLLTRMVTSWTKEAPDDIIAWLDKDHEQLDPKNRSSILYHLTRAIVVERPLETFELINKHSEKPHSYFPVIFRNNELAVAERIEILRRVQEMAPELDSPEAKEKFLTKNLKALVLGQKNHHGDFQTAIDMIKAADLQTDDIEFIWNPAINDLGYYIKDEQTGEWINWLRDSAPEEKSARRIKQLFERWERRDPDEAKAFSQKHGFDQQE